MKAITLHQPWASAIALGFKHYETRSWKTNYRGLIAIHAAKRPLDNPSFAKQFFDTDNLPFGSVVAVADLVDCLPMTEDLIDSMSVTERVFGDWCSGRFAWQLENIRPLKEPVPYKGMQGLWTLPDDIKLETS